MTVIFELVRVAVEISHGSLATRNILKYRMYLFKRNSYIWKKVQNVDIDM